MLGVSNYAVAFKSYCGDERSSPIVTKGPCRGATDRGINGVVRGAKESYNRIGLGAIFPSGFPIATFGKIRVSEVSGG